MTGHFRPLPKRSARFGRFASQGRVDEDGGFLYTKYPRRNGLLDSEGHVQDAY